ncbi:MAG: hypothetical protein HC901_00550 [Bdellovibrionaceae bacterium]|nr:hypothetical protein [Pseudobdellovibrionaceae bacterium]
MAPLAHPSDGVDDLGYAYAQKLGTIICIQNSGFEETMIAGSCIQGLTIWYPAQNPATVITPNPWSIKDDGFPKAYIHRITLLNSYNGIFITDGSGADIWHVYGSAHEVGISGGPVSGAKVGLI